MLNAVNEDCTSGHAMMILRAQTIRWVKLKCSACLAIMKL